MANLNYEPHPSVLGVFRPRIDSIDIPNPFIAKQETQVDFQDIIYTTPGEYSFASISGTADAPTNAPGAPGKMIVEMIEATGDLDLTLINVFSGMTWKRGYQMPSGPYGSWTLTESSEVSTNFAGTETLNLSSTFSLPGDSIPDLTAITDGPAGIAGIGVINSIEMPTDSGMHLRTIREINTGDIHSNYYNGTNWQGWQKNATGDQLTTIPPVTVSLDPSNLNPGAVEEFEVAFNGALQGDGFDVASSIDIGSPANGFFQATANYSRDDFVRIVIRNNDVVAHDLPAADWYVFKDNSQLPSPISSTVIERTFAQISDQADSANQAAIKTREIVVYITDRAVYVRPGASLNPTGPWSESGTTVVYVTPA